MADVPASVSVVTGEQIEQTPARPSTRSCAACPSFDLPIASTNEQRPTDTIVSMRGPDHEGRDLRPWSVRWALIGQ